ncbi:MAG: Ig-like domain-containing protein [Cyclobacteriaceae bacterium]
MRKIFYIILLISLWQCARQSQPAGGPKDTDPPELISSIPINGQKNFKGKTIEVTFNEFVKLKNAEDEIVITPTIGKSKFLAKRNKVIITPSENWKDSTTYSIAFREAVQDITESNPTEDLHLAFSTGSTIDSLKFFGYVTEMFKEKLPEKITVALYQSDTFDIFKHKPIYFTKTNKKGRFSIRNLKGGKYFAYAFDDKNKNSKVDSKSERFTFKTTPIILETLKDSIVLELIHVDTRPIKITSVRNT